MKQYFCRAFLSTLFVAPILLLTMGAGQAAVDVFDWPTSVRGFGMAFTGTADDTPGNSFYNPANLATVRGVHYTAAYGDLYKIISDSWALGNSINVGFQDVLGGSTPVGLGAELRYSRYDFGRSVFTNSLGQRIGTYNTAEDALGLSVAGCVRLSEKYTIAVGAGAKRFSADYGRLNLSSSTILAPKGSGLFLDAGLRTAMLFTTQSGFTLEPAFGFSYVNSGSDVELNGLGTVRIPEIINYGLSLRVETPSEQSVTEFLDAEVPLAAFTVNIDVNDPRETKGTTMYGIGVEVAVIQMFFLRVGYMDAENWFQGETTFGAGIGATEGRLQGRLEFARVPYGHFEEINRYGISLGVLF